MMWFQVIYIIPMRVIAPTPLAGLKSSSLLLPLPLSFPSFSSLFFFAQCSPQSPQCLSSIHHGDSLSVDPAVLCSRDHLLRLGGLCRGLSAAVCPRSSRFPSPRHLSQCHRYAHQWQGTPSLPVRPLFVSFFISLFCWIHFLFRSYPELLENWRAFRSP